MRNAQSSVGILVLQGGEDVKVRQGDGMAGVHGTAGEFMWTGYAGTFFWAEPKEQVCARYMTEAPSRLRAYYRQAMKNLAAQAVAD